MLIEKFIVDFYCFKFVRYNNDDRVAGNNDNQKQPPRAVRKKSCSENTQQVYTRTPMPKSDFNKFAFQLY